MYSLQRLIECAYHNLNRIRLIWSRLWAALAPHLVSAACHANPKVAAYAVDALRQLVAKLLVRAERAELTSFNHQDEALRPFVAVLKHCDSAAVREQTVHCIAQAITAHPRGLGSGVHQSVHLQGNQGTGLFQRQQRRSLVQRQAQVHEPKIWAACFPVQILSAAQIQSAVLCMCMHGYSCTIGRPYGLTATSCLLDHILGWVSGL